MQLYECRKIDALRLLHSDWWIQNDAFRSMHSGWCNQINAFRLRHSDWCIRVIHSDWRTQINAFRICLHMPHSKWRNQNDAWRLMHEGQCMKIDEEDKKGGEGGEEVGRCVQRREPTFRKTVGGHVIRTNDYYCEMIRPCRFFCYPICFFWNENMLRAAPLSTRNNSHLCENFASALFPNVDYFFAKSDVLIAAPHSTNSHWNKILNER